MDKENSTKTRPNRFGYRAKKTSKRTSKKVSHFFTHTHTQSFIHSSIHSYIAHTQRCLGVCVCVMCINFNKIKTRNVHRSPFALVHISLTHTHNTHTHKTHTTHTHTHTGKEEDNDNEKTAIGKNERTLEFQQFEQRDLVLTAQETESGDVQGFTVEIQESE